MNKELSPKQRDELLAALKARFDANKARHQGLVWAKVQARLETKPDKLWSLAEMERTGGEPDEVGHDKSRANTFSSRAPNKRRPAAAACVATAKSWMSSTRRGATSSAEAARSGRSSSPNWSGARGCGRPPRPIFRYGTKRKIMGWL